MLSDNEIENLAASLRNEIGISPVDPLLDIVKIIKDDCGYQYIEQNFEDDFSGFSQYLGGLSYLIGFNLDHYWSEKFKRFTLCHELGHVTIPKHVEILKKQKMHRSKPEYSSFDEIEKEADKFAINFLAPKNGFISRISKLDFSISTIEHLSEHYQISQYATVLRFLELTDLSVALIVCNGKGIIEYERRSASLYSSLYHSSIKNNKVSRSSLVNDFINNHTEYFTMESTLNEWYPNLPPIEIPCNESIIKLEYSDKYLVLIEPHVSDITEFIQDTGYDNY